MKTRNRFIPAILLGLGMLAVSAGASARDRYDDHYVGHRWGHERYVRGYYGPVVEHRYIVREPRYYGPVYEPVVPVYRAEPGVVVRFGLPPIVIR